MYYYLYDTFLNDKKYEKVLDRIKTRLLDLDIQGKHERMSLLKSADDLLSTEIKRGAKTIIVVGNDKTFLKVVDIVAKQEVTLGIIPLGEPNNIARALGLLPGDKSCEILAARKIVEFDLGKANNIFFFSNIEVTKNIDRIAISHQGYKVIPKAQCSAVGIYNFFVPVGHGYDRAMEKVNPRDRQLDLVIKSEVRSKGVSKLLGKKKKIAIDSIIQGENFEIKSFEYLPVWRRKRLK
jgi:hypothetical protein